MANKMYEYETVKAGTWESVGVKTSLRGKAGWKDISVVQIGDPNATNWGIVFEREVRSS